jgi:hypothetical protein
LFLLFFTTLTLSGCVMPEPVLRLTPLNENVVWRDGRAAQIKEGAPARVAVAFEQEATLASRRLVGFRVEIQNVSDKPFLVNPMGFYYAACVTAPNGTRKCQPSHLAVNPEQVLLDLDLQHSRRQADVANEAALGTALLFLDLATATASLASSGHHRATVPLAGAAAAGASVSATYARGEAEATDYELQRSDWSSTALRKTTLLPGEGVAGVVFIDRQLDAGQIILAVRFDDHVLDFPFRQIRYDARPRTTSAASRPTRMLAR